MRYSINFMYIRTDYLSRTLPILLLTYGTGMNSGKWNGMKTESEWEKCNATKDMILQPKQSVLTKKRCNMNGFPQFLPNIYFMLLPVIKMLK